MVILNPNSSPTPLKHCLKVSAIRSVLKGVAVSFCKLALGRHVVELEFRVLVRV